MDALRRGHLLTPLFDPLLKWAKAIVEHGQIFRSRDLLGHASTVADNTRTGYQVELVDLTILMVSAVPILLWGVYAIPRSVLWTHPAKLWIATAFFGLPLLAVAAQGVVR